MKITGRISYFNEAKGFAIIESKHSDGVIDRYFLHVSNIYRCVPDHPMKHCSVVFNVGEQPVKQGQLPHAIDAEIGTVEAGVMCLSVGLPIDEKAAQ